MDRYDMMNMRIATLAEGMRGRLPHWIIEDILVYVREGEEQLALEYLADIADEKAVVLRPTERHEFLALARYWRLPDGRFDFLKELVGDSPRTDEA